MNFRQGRFIWKLSKQRSKLGYYIQNINLIRNYLKITLKKTDYSDLFHEINPNLAPPPTIT